MRGLLFVVCAAAVGAGLAVLVLAALPDPAGPAARTATDVDCTRACRRPGSPARRTPVGRAPRLRVLVCLGAGAALFALTSWPVLLPVGAAGAWFLPGLLRLDGGAAAKIARVDGIATFTEMMRDTLNAAAGLGQAVTAAARCAPEPIAAEAGELAAVIEDRTVPLDAALRDFGQRLADPTGDLVVLALAYAARNSARDLAPLLADLAEAARAEAAMRVRIAVARSRTRTAVRVITAVVLGLGTLLYVFDGAFLNPYGTAIGQLALLAISVLFATAFGWLARLARPTGQPRLLAPDSGEDHPPAVAGDVVRLPAPRRATAPAATAPETGVR